MTPLERAIYHVIAAHGQIGVHIPNDRPWSEVRGHQYLDRSIAGLVATLGHQRLEEIVTIILAEEEAAETTT